MERLEVPSLLCIFSVVYVRAPMLADLRASAKRFPPDTSRVFATGETQKGPTQKAVHSSVPWLRARLDAAPPFLPVAVLLKTPAPRYAQPRPVGQPKIQVRGMRVGDGVCILTVVDRRRVDG